jgi:hypothetical protein
MKTYGGVEIPPPFLTSALDGCEWSASRPGRFTPREMAPGTQWIGGWMGPRAGLDTVKKRKILAPAGNRTNPPFFYSFSKLKTGYFQALTITATRVVTLKTLLLTSFHNVTAKYLSRYE